MSGVSVIDFTPKVLRLLSRVSFQVNHEIKCMSDKEQYSREEFWEYPHSGFGDCEDIALEKRARLVALGFPRGALRLAIGHHKKLLVAHALLLVETSRGTYVLDHPSNDVALWYLTPYNFETRERNDGQWERFDQGLWTYE
jgi:predicted transglutaminase-like cysteine proteinase